MTKQVNNFKVYISCPMTVPMDHLMVFVKKIRAMGADVSYWERGTTYKRDNLMAADAVVVLLPDNKFKYSIGSLPNGTRGEVVDTHFHDIPLFIGYQTGIDRTYQVYSAYVENGVIGGIPENDSRNKLGVMIHKANEAAKAEVDNHITEYYEDRRGPTPIVIERNAKGEPLVSASFKIIDLSTPGGYDRRLLLLLR